MFVNLHLKENKVGCYYGYCMGIVTCIVWVEMVLRESWYQGLGHKGKNLSIKLCVESESLKIWWIAGANF